MLTKAVKKTRLLRETGEAYFYIFIYLFVAALVFIALHRLSLVAMSRGYSSLWWLLLLRSTGFRCSGFCSCSTQSWSISLIMWSAVRSQP